MNRWIEHPPFDVSPLCWMAAVSLVLAAVLLEHGNGVAAHHDGRQFSVPILGGHKMDIVPAFRQLWAVIISNGTGFGFRFRPHPVCLGVGDMIK